jgi:diacylglycerol kinase (ATP)
MISQNPGDIESMAARVCTDGFDAVVAAGGDGTLNEMLNGCMSVDRPVTVGLIPLGTGNDFARVMGLPTDLLEALQVIRDAHVRKLDVVRVTGSKTRFMINIAAGGFAGVVSEKLTPDLKAAWGPLSYLRGMVDALGEMQTYHTRIRIDGGAPEHFPMLNVVVANGSHVARGIPIAPMADPSDGLMEIVAIREVPLPSLALLAPQILAAAHMDNDEVIHLRARHFSIESKPSMTFNVDGEVMGEGAFEFALLPGAISFLAPLSRDRE